MIFNIIFELAKTLVMTVLGLLPDLPAMPEAFTSVMGTVTAYIMYGTKFLVAFLGLSFIQIMFPVLVILINFKWIYHSTVWIIKKIPIGVS